MKRGFAGLWVLCAAYLGGCSNEYGLTCGAPGHVQECPCSDGTSGVQICDKTGEWGACEQLASCGEMGSCTAADPEAACLPAGNGGNGGSGGIGGNGNGNNGMGGDGDGTPPPGDGDGDASNLVPGAWDACQNTRDCAMGLSCSSSGGYCAPACSLNMQQCPAAATGTAVPTCESSPFTGTGCVLDCSGGENCPDGMQCSSGGFSSSQTCGW